MTGLKPVGRSIKPEYPTKGDAKADPQLLRLMPARWRQDTAVIGLLTTCTLALTSCQQNALNAASPHPIGIPIPPRMMSENDALHVIRVKTRDNLTALQKSYPVSRLEKQLIYVYYNEITGKLEEVNLYDDNNKEEIDAFSVQKDVGFEYLGLDLENPNQSTGFYVTGQTIHHAESDKAYVLVIPVKEDENPGKEDSIAQLIDSFMDWLKAEGILQ